MHTHAHTHIYIYKTALYIIPVKSIGPSRNKCLFPIRKVVFSMKHVQHPMFLFIQLNTSLPHSLTLTTLEKLILGVFLSSYEKWKFPELQWIILAGDIAKREKPRLKVRLVDQKPQQEPRTISRESSFCVIEGWLLEILLPDWTSVMKRNVLTSTMERRRCEAGLYCRTAFKIPLLSKQKKKKKNVKRL